jgi:basic membrane lipoprotein Med (substrate-binding protein (PBP1-ABC) superfamily)
MLMEIIKATEEGVYGGKSYVLNLENGGLKIAYNEAFDLPEEIKAQADAVVAGIIDGSIPLVP